MTTIPWLRFLAISAITWIANAFLVTIYLVFIVPRSLKGYGLAVSVWVFSFIIAFLFAQWAFSTRMPKRNDTIALCAIWLVVSIVFQAFSEIYQYGQIVFLFLTVDLVGSYVIELAAVVLASFIVRRHRLQATAAEGIEI